MPAILDQISIATLAMHPDLNTKLLSRDSALLRILQAKSSSMTGSPLKIKVRYKRNNGGWYAGFDTFNTARVEQLAEGSVNWTNVYVNVTVDEDTLVTNAGMTIKDLLSVNSLKNLPKRDRVTLINIFGAELEGAIDDKQQLLNSAIYTGTSSAKQLTGLDGIIAGSTAHPGAYAGMAAADLGTFDDGRRGFLSGTDGSSTKDNVWAAKTKTFLPTQSVLLENLADGLNDCNQGSSDGIDYVIMPLDIWSSLELQLEGQKTRPNENLSAIGFRTNIEWVSFGCTFVADPFCPAGTVYGINTNHLKLATHPGLQMEMSQFKEPTDQAAITAQVKSKLQTWCDDRAKHFKIDGLTA